MFLANVSLSQPKAVPGQRNGIRITEIRSISAQNLSPLGFLAEVGVHNLSRDSEHSWSQIGLGSSNQ